MISNIELAEKWKLPILEVRRIVAFADKYHFDVTRAHKMYQSVNHIFKANVIKSGNTQKYYGVLYQADKYQKSIIVALSFGFDKPLEAMEAVNRNIATRKLDWKTCYRLGVTPEAGQLIRHVDESQFPMGPKVISLAMAHQGRGCRS